MRNFTRRFVPLALLAALLVGVWQSKPIYEWWFLRNYQPPVEIVALADRAALSEQGRREFYLADPRVDDKAQFNTHCPVSERSLILGCYHGKIFVLRVDRPELAKVMEVTAAHEMLHAAYADLSGTQRRQVNQWIESFYRTVNDKKVQELVAEYEKTEPGERLNELHSILPTQVASLSPELEQYYQRYFTNRSLVVAAYKSYEAVFEDLENRIEGLRGQIDSLKSQLDSMEGQIDQRRAELEATNRQMDGLLAAGNISGYNVLVGKQNAQVQAYNSLVAQYRSLVELHNRKVEEVNQLALEQNQLVNSIDASHIREEGGR